jgi:hypothetical protein
MSTYNLQIGWSGKDAAGGIISGDDFHTEFTAAKNAINDKAELAGSASQAFSALTAAAGTNTSQVATTAFVTAAAATSSYINDKVYPVGSVYIGVTSANPSTLLGTGTWVAFGEGDVLVGYKSGDSDFGTAEGTGGAKTHTLTASESGLPSHSHMQRGGGFDGSTGIESGSNLGSDQGQTGDTGGTNASQSHNNLQPYITVYMWKRTA